MIFSGNTLLFRFCFLLVVYGPVLGWRYKDQAHLIQRHLASRNIKSDQLSESELENLLRVLLEPGDNPSIQLQSLRRDIIRKLEDGMEKQRLVDELGQFKRSMNSLARWNNLPGKRNVEALARAGYIRTLPEDEQDNEGLKRSIAALAKNGQLPLLKEEEDKRGIAELARNGELPNKREMQELIDELYDKRNIGSLARYSNFPSYGKRFLGSLAKSNDLYRYSGDKRNVASLARGGMMLNGKRNVAAMLRQDNYDRRYGRNAGSYYDEEEDASTESPVSEDKRNIGSVKAQFKPKMKRNVAEEESKKQGATTRPKRQIDYYDSISEEYPQPVYQNQNLYDYEDLFKAALAGDYPETEKRFLGSVARSGWFRPSSSSRFTEVSKRHIGSLARLGWLPSFRQARRFNRSGRSTNYYYDCSTDRKASANGESQDDSFTKSTIPIDDKRLLLQPAVDKILFKKMFTHPRLTAYNWN